MDNKLNDWVLETLLNPTFTLEDFRSIGIDATNTSIYSKDKYINSPLILQMPLFQTNGNFDVAKFTDFYDNVSKSYLDMAQTTYLDKLSDKAIFSYNNLWVEPLYRGKPVEFNIVKISNPNRQKMGIESLGFISAPTMSPLEIALNEKIYNPETNTWEESPNDSWLFRDWFDPVAVATYDTDVDANGNPTTDESKIVHRKGEYKINPDTGTYYYEKLNGRSPYGKLVLSPFDIITRDGSVANLFDFFDSDGLTKSFTGSVMKTAARIAPMFLPVVGTPYIAFNLAVELGKVLPIIYKTTFGLGSEDHSLMNTIEGIAASFSADLVSLEGQLSFFNSENILNLIADVAKLLYEQRWLFSKAPAYFKKYSIVKDKKIGESALDIAQKGKASEYFNEAVENGRLLQALSLKGEDAVRALQGESLAKAALWAEKYLKSYLEFGRQLSRMYMTATSSYHAYLDAKLEGASDMEAAMVFWGYLAGEYAILSTELGEHVLPELRASKQEIKSMVQSLSEKAGGLEAKKLVGIAQDRLDKAKGLKKYFLEASNLAIKTFKKGLRPTTVGMNSTFTNALGEGIEEVSEELLYDVTRVTFNTLQFLAGRDFKLKVFDNWAERYGQSFFGGALGGALFEGINNILNRHLYNPGSEMANQQLIYHIRNGRANEVREVLNTMRKNNAFGNPNLSVLPKKLENGEIIFEEGTPDDNLNEAIYKLLTNYVNNIEYVLSRENMMIPDARLVSGDEIDSKDLLQQIRYQYLMSSPTAGKMLLDWNDMSDEFLSIYSKIGELEGESDLAVRKSPQWNDDLAEYNRQLEELRKRREEFFSSKTQAQYIGAMMFSSNPQYSKPFVNITFRDFAENRFNKKFEDLTEHLKKTALTAYGDYLLYEANKKITLLHEVFFNLDKKLSGKLSLLGEDGYKKYIENRNKMLTTTFTVKNGDKVNTISFIDLMKDLFGHGDMTPEEITEKAERLKTVYNPFNELNALFLSSDEDPTSNEYTALEIHSILSNIVSGVKQLKSSGYIDSELAKTVNAIRNKFLKVNPNKLQTAFLFSNVTSNPIIDSAIGNDYVEYAYNSTLLDIKEKANSLIQKIQNILDTETSIDEFFMTQLAQLRDLIADDVNRLFEESHGDEKNYNPDLIKLSDELDSLLENTYLNPIAALISELKISTPTSNGLTVIDLLSKSEAILKNKDIKDFVLEGDITIDDIKEAKIILQLIEAVIRASQTDDVDSLNPFGYNITMNKFLKDAGEEAVLGEIDTETAALMMQDLSTYYKKLDFIELLHNMNKESSLRALGRIGNNINYLSFEVLGRKDSPLYTVVKDGKIENRKIKGKINGVEVEEDFLDDSILDVIEENASTLNLYYKDLERPVDISNEDDIKEMAKERLAIEVAVYNRVKELCTKFGNTELVLDQILDGFTDFSELSVNSRYTTKTGSYQGILDDTLAFNDSDRLSYFASVCAVDPRDYEYYYTLIIKEDNSGIAPIPSLKLAIRLMFGGITNMPFYNAIINSSKVAERSCVALKNAMLVTGVPGSGKTSACAKFAFKMIQKFNPQATVWCVGPAQILAENLAKSIEVADENRTLFTKESLFSQFGLSDINNDQYLTIIGEKYTDPKRRDMMIKAFNLPKWLKLDIKNNVTFNTVTAPSAIFIDEVTHFTAPELLVLSKFAQANHIPLLLFGDPSQSGNMSYIKVDGEEIGLKMTNTFMLTSPKLTVSMRVSNTNKRDNSYVTRQAAEKFPTETGFNEYANEKSAEKNIMPEFEENFKLKYTESDKGLFGDRMIAPSDLTVEKVKTLITNLEPGEKIGYIYHDTNSSVYKMLNGLSEQEKGSVDFIRSINFFDEISAQGNEAQFFIVDIDWHGRAISDEIPKDDWYAKYQSLVQALNTTITRSKLGSYIIDNGLSYIVSYDNFKALPVESVAVVDDFKNDTTLQNYKQKQIDISEYILDGYVPGETVSTGIVAEAQAEPSSSNTEGDDDDGESSEDGEDEGEGNDGEEEPPIPQGPDDGGPTGPAPTGGVPPIFDSEGDDIPPIPLYFDFGPPSTFEPTEPTTGSSEPGPESKKPKPITGSSGASDTYTLISSLDFINLLQSSLHINFGDNKVIVDYVGTEDSVIKSIMDRYKGVWHRDGTFNPVAGPLEIINKINTENGFYTISIIPNADFNSGSFSKDGMRKSKMIKKEYVKYIVKTTQVEPKDPPKKPIGSEIKVGDLYTSDSDPLTYKVLQVKDSKVFILGKGSSTILEIPYNEFISKYKKVTVTAVPPVISALNQGTSNTKLTQKECEQVIKRIATNSNGRVIEANFGYRAGIPIERNAEGQFLLYSYNEELRNYEKDDNGNLLHITPISSKLNMNPSDLGIFIQPNTYVEVDTFLKAKKALAELRSTLQYVNVQNLLELSDVIIKKFLDIKDKYGLTPIFKNSENSGIFLLRLQESYAPDEEDYIFNPNNKSIPNLKSIVYTINGIDITLGTLQGPGAISDYKNTLISNCDGFNVWQQYPNPLDIRNKTIAYFDQEKIFAEKLNKYIRKMPFGSVLYFLLDPNYIFSSARVTVPRLVKITNDNTIAENGEEQWTTYDEYVQADNIIISDPYIIAGSNYLYLDPTLISKILNGLLVAVYTDDLDLEYNGEKVANNPNLLIKLWLDSRNINRSNLDLEKVKLAFFTPKGLSLKETIGNFVKFLNERGNTDIVVPMGTTNTALKILLACVEIDSKPHDSLRFALALHTFLKNVIVDLKYADRVDNSGRLSPELMAQKTMEKNAITNIKQAYEDLVDYYAGPEQNIDNYVSKNAYRMMSMLLGYFTVKSGNLYMLRDGNNDDSDEKFLLDELDNIISNYEGSYTYKGLTASFPRGIYFNPIYKRTGDKYRTPEEFLYPAENRGSFKFITDVSLQCSNFMLNPSSMAIINDIIKDVPTTRTVTKLFKLAIEPQSVEDFLPKGTIIQISGLSKEGKKYDPNGFFMIVSEPEMKKNILYLNLLHYGYKMVRVQKSSLGNFVAVGSGRPLSFSFNHIHSWIELSGGTVTIILSEDEPQTNGLDVFTNSQTIATLDLLNVFEGIKYDDFLGALLPINVVDAIIGLNKQIQVKLKNDSIITTSSMDDAIKLLLVSCGYDKDNITGLELYNDVLLTGNYSRISGEFYNSGSLSILYMRVVNGKLELESVSNTSLTELTGSASEITQEDVENEKQKTLDVIENTLNSSSMTLPQKDYFKVLINNGDYQKIGTAILHIVNNLLLEQSEISSIRALIEKFNEICNLYQLEHGTCSLDQLGELFRNIKI